MNRVNFVDRVVIVAICILAKYAKLAMHLIYIRRNVISVIFALPVYINPKL